MADGNGGNGGLYFIVGALCVAVRSALSSCSAAATWAPRPRRLRRRAGGGAGPVETTKNVTIEKTVVEPTKVIEHERR